MRHSLFDEQLMLAQPLENDRVRTFTVQLDLAVRRTDDRRHALPGRIELAHVQDLVLVRPSLDVDKRRLRFASLTRRVEIRTKRR